MPTITALVPPQEELYALHEHNESENYGEDAVLTLSVYP
jgi:hypothetical protein